MGNRGFSVLAVVLVLLGCMFLAALIVPGFLRACGCGPTESTAVGMLRGINSSQQAYASACAEGGFAPAFADLMRPPLTGGTPFFHALEPKIEGWVITMRVPAGAELPGTGCNGGRRAKAYFAEVHRVEADRERNYFATDESGTIYWSSKPIAPGMQGAQPIE